MTTGYPITTPGRLHAKRIIAWWTPYIPQDKTDILTLPVPQRNATRKEGGHKGCPYGFSASSAALREHHFR